MKHKIIIMTKKKIMVYSIMLLVVIIGIILLLTLGGGGAGSTPSSGYTYLQYKDGVYEGNEKTEAGNIKVEVTIKKGKIKDIKITEFPQKYIDNNPLLKEQIKQLSSTIIKSQNTAVAIDNSQATAYLLTKLSKAIVIALDQSMITQ